MAAVNYTAKRSIITGHVLDTAYDLDLILEQADRSVRTKKNQIRSLGGNTETILQSMDVSWSLTIGSLTGATLNGVREFLDSVQGGEIFTLDVMGSVGAPDNPLSVIADGDYMETRVNNSNLFTISFNVRVV